MMTDIWAVVWKEWRELLARGGRGRGGRVGFATQLLALTAAAGVILPLQEGVRWLTGHGATAFMALVAVALVLPVAGDSFAGERERRTLETLLSSRVSTRAVLLGKVAAAMAVGWGGVLLSLLVGLATVNLIYGRGHLVLYSPAAAMGAAGMGLVVAGLAATAGVLVSLRAPSVRQAQQALMTALLLATLLPVLAGFLAMRWPRASKELLAAVLAVVGGTAGLVWILMAVLAAVDVALLAAALARCERGRLMLD